jgi:hypothetical protein
MHYPANPVLPPLANVRDVTGSPTFQLQQHRLQPFALEDVCATSVITPEFVMDEMRGDLQDVRPVGSPEISTS